MSKISLPHQNPSAIREKLKKCEWENNKIISFVEHLLLEKRGWVFKMPKPKTPVILLLSGGLDSVVTWKLLLDKYQLDVYPLNISGPLNPITKLKKMLGYQTGPEKAINYFSDYFKSIPSTTFRPVEKWHTTSSHPLSQLFIKKEFNSFHPEHLLKIVEELNSNSNSHRDRIHSPMEYYQSAIKYSQYLKLTKNIDANTIITSTLPKDGLMIPSQTLTNLRLQMLLFNFLTDSWNKSLISLTNEPELGNIWNKEDIIKIGTKLKLPLEKTWSCYRNYKYQCGDKCLTCFYRQDSFELAGVQDKTIYLSD